MEKCDVTNFKKIASQPAKKLLYPNKYKASIDDKNVTFVTEDASSKKIVLPQIFKGKVA